MVPEGIPGRQTTRSLLQCSSSWHGAMLEIGLVLRMGPVPFADSIESLWIVDPSDRTRWRSWSVCYGRRVGLCLLLESSWSSTMMAVVMVAVPSAAHPNHPFLDADRIFYHRSCCCRSCCCCFQSSRLFCCCHAVAVVVALLLLGTVRKNISGANPMVYGLICCACVYVRVCVFLVPT